VLALLLFVLAAVAGYGSAAAQDDGTADEDCIRCHGESGFRPVGDISNTRDVHYVDLDERGPITDSGYRQVNLELTSVDVTGP